MAVLRATILPYFNPLRREGGDRPAVWSTCGWDDFNPLRREGGDGIGSDLNCGNWDFNPLRREGGDK